MKKSSFLLIMFALLSVASCDKLGVMMDMRKAVGETIIFPESLEYYPALAEYDNTCNPKASIVIWYDSTMCTGCKLNALDNLSFIESFCHDSIQNVNVNIIFSPTARAVEPFRDGIPKFNRSYPIYLDSCQFFARANEQLPKKFFLHTFLLDKDNRVIMCGDPLPSPQLWETYKKKIRQLTQD